MNKSTVLPSGASFNNLIIQFLVKQTGLFNTLSEVALVVVLEFLFYACLVIGKN